MDNRSKQLFFKEDTHTANRYMKIIINKQRNANQNHIEMSPHFSNNKHYKADKKIINAGDNVIKREALNNCG
jgi:hypothetical protein